MYFEKFSLSLLAQMGQKFSQGDISTADVRHFRECICEYQMYFAAKSETLTQESHSLVKESARTDLAS